jgi:membrane protease YdiL (CAAX protease family)
VNSIVLLLLAGFLVLVGRLLGCYRSTAARECHAFYCRGGWRTTERVKGIGSWLRTVFQTLAAELAVTIPYGIALAAVLAPFFTGSESDGDAKVLEALRQHPLWLAAVALTLLVLIEEALARGLPGLCAWLAGKAVGPEMRASTLFVGLLFCNACWALLHIGNYGPFTEQHPFTPLYFFAITPVFLAGFFFSYAYARAGLWASFAVHLLHNGIAIGAALLFLRLAGKAAAFLA